MAGKTSRSQLGQKRGLSTEVVDTAPKRARSNPSKLLMPPPQVSRDSSAFHTFKTQIDQSLFCERCNIEEYPQYILEEIRRPMCGVWLKKLLIEDWETDTLPSCPCCQLLRYARCIRKENHISNHVAYFYVATDLEKPSAEDEPLRVLGITEDFLSVRQPKESCGVFKQPFQEAQHRDRINLSVFKRQIAICKRTHACCNLQARKQQRAVGLRVIDCRRRKVVSALDSCKYAALSYVWGSPSHPVGDLENFPQTISDAMTAALGLGIRFLWVDRYCINQNNPTEKHSQIQQMGLIYSQAEVTFVAAAGKGPDHGLPGISRRQPKKETGIRIGQYVLRPLHASSQELLARSAWMTRAWTFQEFILSKRRLVFTDQHAFLQCQTSMMEEWPASAWKYTFSPTEFVDMGCNLDIAFPFDPQLPHINQVIDHVQSYCTRQLSYPSDALNGFLGVLSMFEHGSNPVHHLWGLPYSPVKLGQHSRIHLPLMWKTQNGTWESDGEFSVYRFAIRRKKFPSWSWAGREGVPTFAMQDIDRPLPLRIEVQKEDGAGLLSLEEFAAQQVPGKEISASRFLHIQGWTHPLEVA